MPTEIADEEITLAVGALRLRISPYGASLRGLWRETADGQKHDIITGYTGAKGKVGGQGDALIPFPGRVRDGKYTFDGHAYEMDRNDKDGPNAIHGFLRLAAWEVEGQTDNAVRFAVTLDPAAHPGYPFALRASVTYVLLEEKGLTCALTIENTGTQAAPVAAGFHPFLRSARSISTPTRCTCLSRLRWNWRTCCRQDRPIRLTGRRSTFGSRDRLATRFSTPVFSTRSATKTAAYAYALPMPPMNVRLPSGWTTLSIMLCCTPAIRCLITPAPFACH